MKTLFSGLYTFFVCLFKVLLSIITDELNNLGLVMVLNVDESRYDLII
jgi:hypothetical protein